MIVYESSTKSILSKCIQLAHFMAWYRPSVSPTSIGYTEDNHMVLASIKAPSSSHEASTLHLSLPCITSIFLVPAIMEFDGCSIIDVVCCWVWMLDSLWRHLLVVAFVNNQYSIKRCTISTNMNLIHWHIATT